jgi:hypothetical protein
MGNPLQRLDEIPPAFPLVSTKKFGRPQFSHNDAPVCYCDEGNIAAECFQSMRGMSGMPAVVATTVETGNSRG